mgnify:CR=1 FL=1
MTEENNEVKPMTFADKWHAEKLLKKAKKKARKSLEQRGHGRKDASKMVNQAIKKIVADNRPERKSAGRGG